MAKNSKKDIKWIKAEENPWNVPVLDLRPVISDVLTFSEDPEHAKNAISYGGDDGKGFRNQIPPINRKINVSITYPIDRILLDGILFTPNVMEHKWAVFYHEKTIIFVRSWLRQVMVLAKVVPNITTIEVTEIHGVFTTEEESPEQTELYFDFLIRNLVFGVVYPVPISEELANTPQKVPMWCFSLFGDISLVATPHVIPKIEIKEPIRSISLFHIAIAKGDIKSVTEFLEKGIPIDILAQDELSPLHWSLVTKDFEMASFLLEKGANIDSPSFEGATPLMSAVQNHNLAKIEYLIENGADINKGDNRGFTSLHRSAEIGNLEVTSFLLKCGADPNIGARGQTPISLAEKGKHLDIVKKLKEYL